MVEDFYRFLKGFAMGAANVIPGVSGGTIAFITGIYERLIEAVKSFDLVSAKLLFGFRFREFAEKVDLRFLAALAAGILVSFLTLARVLEWAFKFHETLVWAFFFGLIAVSIPAVGRMVKRWTAGVMVMLLVGCGTAASLAFLTPAGENDHPLYLVLCGVVAMCSMIIPGLSGSFVLLLMGNYKLVMIRSLTALSAGEWGGSLRILIPVGIGAVLGMVLLARLLSWLFKNHHDMAVALITGFVAGSLLIIWPWKDQVPKRNEAGLIFVKTRERAIEVREGSIEEVKAAAREADEELIIKGYDNWHLPSFTDKSTGLAIGLMIAGGLLILFVERAGQGKEA